jgi:uncharacterized protein YuzE
MKIKYFSDTDTALVEFTDNKVVETKEIGENVYLDRDKNGNLVSMTIEHAPQQRQTAGIFLSGNNRPNSGHRPIAGMISNRGRLCHRAVKLLMCNDHRSSCLDS